MSKIVLDPVVLNYGLHLAMQWGEDWLKPIQSRLGTAYPALSSTELDEINALCQEAMRHGHAAVLPLANMSDAERIATWRADVLGRYAWVDENNLSHMYSQGMYYSMK